MIAPRNEDVGRLNRIAYAGEAARLILPWAEAQAQSANAGYYIDQRQGGLIRVGFTGGNQSQQLSTLISAIGEIAPGRMTTYSSPPAYSYKELLEAWRSASAALSGQPIAKAMVSQAIDMTHNKVEVQTEDVAGMETCLSQHFGLGKFEVIHAIRPSLRSLNSRPAHWTQGGGSPPKFNKREAEGVSSGAIL